MACTTCTALRYVATLRCGYQIHAAAAPPKHSLAWCPGIHAFLTPSPPCHRHSTSPPKIKLCTTNSSLTTLTLPPIASVDMTLPP